VGSTIPKTDTIHANLTVIKPTDPLVIGRYIQGTLVSDDKMFFDALTIPPLMMNNGSKTGSALGCDLRINVPIASPVSDDNVDQGPLRISLAGTIDTSGHMAGDATMSTVILAQDPAQIVRSFTWQGQQ
jgi:hypothetical protein